MCKGSISTLVIAAVLAVTASAQTPPSQPPTPLAALVGTWTLDSFIGAAPFGFDHERAVCSFVPGLHPSAAPDSADEQISSIGSVEGTILIDVADGAVTIHRRYSGSVSAGEFKGRYPAGGDEHTNASKRLVSRTRATVSGGVLTLTGSVSPAAGGGSCRITETLQAQGDLLSVVATGEVGGRTLTSRQEYVRKAK